MRELIARNPHLKLIVEFNPDAMGVSGAGIDEYFRALFDCGFTSISLIENKLREVSFPVDVPLLRQKASSQSVNLLCAKGGARHE